MIRIIDAVMGTGKSTWLINEVNAHPEKKYIILTPYRTEVTRFKDALTGPNVIAIDTEETISKLQRLKDSIREGKTIVATHKLFTMLSKDGFDMIRAHGDYTLIIDETITLVEENGISQDDFKMLEDMKFLETEATSIDGLSIARRTDKGSNYTGQHKNFLAAAHGEHVYRVDRATVVFVTPPEKLKVFESVNILTYLFEGSETDCWLQLHDLDFNHMELRRDTLAGHKLLPHDLKYSGSEFKPLVTIYDDKKLNDIGVKGRATKEPLSHSWFKTTGTMRKKDIDQLRKNTLNFFKNKMKAKGDDILWTCPKGKKDPRNDDKGVIRLKLKDSTSILLRLKHG